MNVAWVVRTYFRWTIRQLVRDQIIKKNVYAVIPAPLVIYVGKAYSQKDTNDYKVLEQEEFLTIIIIIIII